MRDLKEKDARWIALCREAGIAGQSISAGLAALRQADYAATGKYNHAFFSLSIGIERMLKLIVMIDYALEHKGHFPSAQMLKKTYGHDIEKLFKHARAIHEKRFSKKSLYRISEGGIETRIILFLSEFAVSSRYYNLNFLAKNQDDVVLDPIMIWFTSIGSQILEQHYSPRQRQKDIASAQLMQQTIGPFALVRHIAEDGTSLDDIESAALQTSRVKVIQKYGTFYCAKIVRYLFMVLYEMVHAAHKVHLPVPFLYELFFPFLNDDAYLLSRRTFPPQGQ